MISRRLDCEHSELVHLRLYLLNTDVRQNAQTAHKQLDGAEKKLDAALVLLEPGLEGEEGLPLTDIYEELDEDGNVICG
jgi:hypothetical protein